METTRVEDIMIPLDQYPHLPYWFTLRQAMVEIQGSKFKIGELESIPRAVLVFDQAYRLLGYARRRDIMRGLEPRYLAPGEAEAGQGLFKVHVDPNLAELSFDKMAEAIRARADKMISEVMQPIKVTIDVDDHLMKAISEILEYDLCLIPVLRDERVVGVVNTVAVCHELAKIIL